MIEEGLMEFCNFFTIAEGSFATVSKVRRFHAINCIPLLMTAFAIEGLVTPKGGRKNIGLIPVTFSMMSLVEVISRIYFFESAKVPDTSWLKV
nr:hypothetical protein [Candidatus Brachybacter algidus]